MTVAPCDILEVTLTLDTNAYASGDVLADTQEITNGVTARRGLGMLQSLVLVDEDDQKQDIDVLFFSALASLGTENSTPSITDANAREYLGKVEVAAADYDDLGGVAVVSVSNIGLILRAAAGTSLYVGAICRSGTPTYTASGLKLRLGIIWA